MLATKASAKSNRPSTMRNDRTMRTREGQTHRMDLRGLVDRGGIDRTSQQHELGQRRMLLSMLSAAQRNKVDKLMLKMKKLLTPSAHSLRPHDLTPEITYPERLSNVSQRSDRAQINRETLGVDSQRSLINVQDGGNRNPLQTSPTLLRQALMHDVWTQPVVLVVERTTDKACESLL